MFLSRPRLLEPWRYHLSAILIILWVFFLIVRPIQLNFLHLICLVMGSSSVRIQIFMHMMYTFLFMNNFFFVMVFDANHVSFLYNKVDCTHALTILRLVLLYICELLHRSCTWHFLRRNLLPLYCLDNRSYPRLRLEAWCCRHHVWPWISWYLTHVQIYALFFLNPLPLFAC